MAEGNVKKEKRRPLIVSAKLHHEVKVIAAKRGVTMFEVADEIVGQVVGK